MTQWLILLWHRRVLDHRQRQVVNGATEPGVQCYRVVSSKFLAGSQTPHVCIERLAHCRWFPSDGGGGK